MSIPNAMFMNGAKAGQVIYLPDPLPEKVTVATMVNICQHRPEQSNPMLMIEYKVYVHDNPLIPHKLITDDKTIASAYYCMECKAESEAKYKLRELRDKMNEYLDEDEEDEDEQ